MTEAIRPIVILLWSLGFRVCAASGSGGAASGSGGAASGFGGAAFVCLCGSTKILPTKIP